MAVLRHLHRWTPDEWRFMEQVAVDNGRLGLPRPKAITERPEVEAWTRDIWQAFHELGGARSAGWSPDPIACADVAAWCDMHAVGEEWRPMFWRIVHALDLEALHLGAQRVKK